MDRTDSRPVRNGRVLNNAWTESTYKAPQMKTSNLGYPIQESKCEEESEVGAYGQTKSHSSSSLSLSSPSQTDVKLMPGARNSGGSMGDSGYFSHNSTGSLASTVNNLSSSMQGVSIRSREVDVENCYKTDHPKRGHCIIINNRNFKPETKMQSRPGSDVDAANMYRVFKKLGFDVNLQHDKTTVEMLQLISRISKEDHSKCDCIVLVILSHGDEGIVYGTNGFMKLEMLIAPLKGNGCPSLAGKPKLLFIQACRGTMLDEGVDVSDAVPDEEDQKEEAKEEKVYKIPVEADFLYAYSSPAGHFSFRNNTRGSWFIQALTKVLEEHGTQLEIMQLLTRVNRTVALEFESHSRKKEHSGKKQVPSIVSMLTKELYFWEK